MHAKYEVSISNGSKVIAKVKVDNRQTDRIKTICLDHSIRVHKNPWSITYPTTLYHRSTSHCHMIHVHHITHCRPCHSCTHRTDTRTETWRCRTRPFHLHTADCSRSPCIRGRTHRTGRRWWGSCHSIRYRYSLGGRGNPPAHIRHRTNPCHTRTTGKCNSKLHTGTKPTSISCTHSKKTTTSN